MSEKNRWTLNFEANVNLINRQNHVLNMAYDDIVKIFGPPSSETIDDKVQHEWIFSGPNGAVVVIHDWQSLDLYPSKWYLSSLKESHSQDFLKWLNKKIK